VQNYLLERNDRESIDESMRELNDKSSCGEFTEWFFQTLFSKDSTDRLGEVIQTFEPCIIRSKQ
jgi:hypothetical protein